MSFKGAGGSEGGIGRFFLGLAMFIAGAYLLMNAIQVTNHFGVGYQLFNVGGIGVTTGFVLVPFIIGVGMLFFNSNNYLGWFLVVGSLVMLIAGVITSLNFTMRRMSLFELITILVLTFGGLGLFLSSFRKYT
jgi:hypothetical protein